jgi:DNA-binding transcriptional regulator of glucitol operon
MYLYTAGGYYMNLIEKIAVIAFAAWLIQLGLAYRQANQFAQRIRALLKLGLCATGLSGGGYRGRIYVALVVHPLTHRVIRAEQLRGYTVFARPKSLPPLEGHSLDELLLLDTTIEGISPRTLQAVRSAAEFIQKSLEQEASSTLA